MQSLLTTECFDPGEVLVRDHCKGTFGHCSGVRCHLTTNCFHSDEVFVKNHCKATLGHVAVATYAMNLVVR